MTTFNNQQQITLDRTLFNRIINCLLANAGGDASCKHLLLELGRSGLYSPESIDSLNRPIGHENIQEASSTNHPTDAINIQLSTHRSHHGKDRTHCSQIRRSTA